jgi:hypothetical protein
LHLLDNLFLLFWVLWVLFKNERFRSSNGFATNGISTMFEIQTFDRKVYFFWKMIRIIFWQDGPIKWISIFKFLISNRLILTLYFRPSIHYSGFSPAIHPYGTNCSTGQPALNYYPQYSYSEPYGHYGINSEPHHQTSVNRLVYIK